MRLHYSIDVAIQRDCTKTNLTSAFSFVMVTNSYYITL